MVLENIIRKCNYDTILAKEKKATTKHDKRVLILAALMAESELEGIRRYEEYMALSLNELTERYEAAPSDRGIFRALRHTRRANKLPEDPADGDTLPAPVDVAERTKLYRGMKLEELEKVALNNPRDLVAATFVGMKKDAKAKRQAKRERPEDYEEVTDKIEKKLRSDLQILEVETAPNKKKQKRNELLTLAKKLNQMASQILNVVRSDREEDEDEEMRDDNETGDADDEMGHNNDVDEEEYDVDADGE
ncbi:hypothetical protein MMC17_005273 [Xylographa soralifera]|nr:hypothetical protein [Xylographa soralifera]